jgi:hypothetical protein
MQALERRNAATAAILAQTVAMLIALSRHAADLAAVLPSLDLTIGEAKVLAGAVDRISARLGRVEERLANRRPG